VPGFFPELPADREILGLDGGLMTASGFCWARSTSAASWALFSGMVASPRSPEHLPALPFSHKRSRPLFVRCAFLSLIDRSEPVAASMF
jgi:hypothetical protein